MCVKTRSDEIIETMMLLIPKTENNGENPKILTKCNIKMCILSNVDIMHPIMLVVNFFFLSFLIMSSA